MGKATLLFTKGLDSSVVRTWAEEEAAMDTMERRNNTQVEENAMILQEFG